MQLSNIQSYTMRGLYNAVIFSPNFIPADLIAWDLVQS